MENIRYNFEDFIGIMEKLIAPDGCPWDRVQTHESLKRYMIEECYEAVEAINNRDSENLCEELGDVLLQVVFHALLAKKEGLFDINDVIDGVSKKMINRHRHIFGDVSANTPEEVLKSWDEIKKEEKGYTTATQQLKSIPKSLPALIRAEKILSKAEKNGARQADTDEEWNQALKLIEELKEEKNMINEEKMDKIGNLFLIITNISRKNKINPEFALTNASETYINRFEYIENTDKNDGIVNEDTQF